MFDGLLAAHLFGSVVSQMNNLRLLLPANNYGWRCLCMRDPHYSTNQCAMSYV